MPHQIIEYSANLSQSLDIDGLVLALHRAAAQHEALPVSGLRTRAHPVDQYQIADEHPDNGFIAVYLRIGAGRSEALRKEIGMALYDVLVGYTETLFNKAPLALSYEVQEINPTTRWNHNNLAAFLSERSST